MNNTAAAMLQTGRTKIFGQVFMLCLGLFFSYPSISFAKEPFVIELSPTTPKKKSPSHAEEPLDVDLQPYIDFALNWTDYEYRGEPLPKVFYEEPKRLQILGLGAERVANAEWLGQTLPQPAAVYDRKTKKILISSDLGSLASDEARMAIMHETVHYLQDISGYTDSLNGRLSCTESEAYEVQMVWQRIHGVLVETLENYYLESLFEAQKCAGQMTFPKSFNRFNQDEFNRFMEKLEE